jgi:hypothetical protein
VIVLRKIAFVLLMLALIAAASFISSALEEPVRVELLRQKRGFTYLAGMIRLRLRDPIRDAHEDLLNGDRTLYCVGTYSCDPVGTDWPIPDEFSIESTATIGCVIRDGDLEMTYRRAEERYVTSYNRAKLSASPSEAR